MGYGTQQGFPQVSSAFVDDKGQINQAWLQLLIQLWNRTGSGPGINSVDLAVLETLKTNDPRTDSQVQLPQLNSGTLSTNTDDATLLALALNSSIPTGIINTAVAWGVTFSCQDISTKPISTVIGRVPIPFAWTLPATTSNPAGYTVGEVTGAPSAQTDFLLLNDGVSIATLRFAASAHSPTMIKASDTVFVQGDYVDLQTPSNLNGMSGAFGIAAIGVR